MINVCIFRESTHHEISVGAAFPKLRKKIYFLPFLSSFHLHFQFSTPRWSILQSTFIQKFLAPLLFLLLQPQLTHHPGPETCPPLFTPSFVRPSEDACLASKREITLSSRGEGRGGIDYERLALGNSGEITMCQLSRGPFYSPIITSVLAAGLQRTTRLLSFSAPPPFAGGWMDRGAWNDRAPDRPIKVECCSDICPFPIFFFFPNPLPPFVGGKLSCYFSFQRSFRSVEFWEIDDLTRRGRDLIRRGERKRKEFEFNNSSWWRGNYAFKFGLRDSV